MTSYELLKLMNSGKTFISTPETNFYTASTQWIRLIEEVRGLLVRASAHLECNDTGWQLQDEIDNLLDREFSRS